MTQPQSAPAWAAPSAILTEVVRHLRGLHRFSREEAMAYYDDRSPLAKERLCGHAEERLLRQRRARDGVPVFERVRQRAEW
jgi:hypothetical protein